MIKEAYVSFETAKLLKEKGFNELCLKEYYNEGVLSDITIKARYNTIINQISAPTQQMAMAWLREVHNLFIVIDRHYFTIDKISHIASGFKYSIEIKAINTKYVHTDYESFEEACEEAIKYCLENLI